MSRMTLAELTVSELAIVFSTTGYQAMKLGILIGNYFFGGT